MTDVQPYGLTDDVRTARLHGIGSSDAAAIVGADEYRSALEVWLGKTTGNLGDDISDQPRVMWGNILEGVVADHFERTTGAELGVGVVRAQPMLWHAQQPFMFANVDRLLVHNRGFNMMEPIVEPVGVLEIKTAGHYQQDAWEDGPPAKVIVQVQHQLAVTDLDIAYVAVLLEGHDYRTYEVPRDEDLITNLIVIEQQFWQHVQERTPPPVDASSSAHKALASVYALHADDSVELEPALLGAAVEYNATVAGIARLEERKAFLENTFRASIGAHKVGTVAGEKVATWARWQQEQVRWKDLRADHPELESLIAEYTTQSARDRLTISKKVQPA